MNTTPIKNFAIQSRNILKQGVLNRILALGFDIDGNIKVTEPVKIQGGTIFMNQLLDEDFFDAWMQLKEKIAVHKVKEVCEEAAYTWFNRLVAIRIMQKNNYIEPVMSYANSESRLPVIVSQARAGGLTMQMSAQDREKLRVLLADPTKIDAQFALLIEAYCKANPVIYNCFGGIEKYISLLLPDNILAKGGFIDQLNNTTYITDEDYAQSELIGWLYQFYISEKKKEVFDSFNDGKKAEAEDIPAATQIFTPNWIVKYMVQNTLGRIYLDNNPDSSISSQMKYLVKTDEPTSDDAILKIDDIKDYKMIDPAAGSGHILNEGFDLLYAMYMDEFYSPRVAIENIFEKNLIGIDIDTRAKQLATFALLMKAASKDTSFLDAKVMPRVLDMPECFADKYGEPIRDFFPHYGITGEKAIKECTEAFELLRQANNLGSIMKFDISGQTRYAIEDRTACWESKDFVPDAIKKAIPSMKFILALTDKYTAVVANPPYMRSGNMNESLLDYVQRNYPNGKADLFSVFMSVGMDMLISNGKMGMINMHSWMFLSSFEKLRRQFLTSYSFDSLLHLGTRTFDELGGEVVQNAAFVVSKCIDLSEKTTYFRLVEGRNCSQKEEMFLSHDGSLIFRNISPSNFEKIPGSIIGYWLSDSLLDTFKSGLPIRQLANVPKGLSTGCVDRFMRYWYEPSFTKLDFNSTSCSESVERGKKWFPYAKGGSFRRWNGNLEYVVNWENDGVEIKSFVDDKGKQRSRPQNTSFYFKECLTYSAITSGKYSLRYLNNSIFGGGGDSIHIYNKEDLYYVLALMNSVIAQNYLRIISPTINFEVDHIKSIPVLFGNQEIITQLSFQCSNLSLQDWDAHETSWDFKRNELIRMKDNCGGNVADLDLLDPEEAKEIQSQFNVPTDGNLISDCVNAYRCEWDRKFLRLHMNEEELNRQFIEIYGLQDELTPDVPLDEITILQAGEITHVAGRYVWNDDNLIKQFISYAIGCWMGRYRLDKEGLNIAYYPRDEEICSYNAYGCKFEIDDDGIIPLMSHQNPFEDDNALQKIVNFVRIVFGTEHLTENLNFIEHCLGKSIEEYLMKDFWKDHKKMYQNHPIYWLFRSKKGAFQVLVYMHRMNPYTAEKVRTKYLLPYIEYLENRMQQDKDRGADLTTVERRALAKMETALKECQEYHEKLHDVAIRNIGFDLDDGVVVNYAKFGDVLAKIK